MILRNKQTQITFRLCRWQFMKKYAADLSSAINNFKMAISDASVVDFFSDIESNFNTYAESEWLIERL
jgi:hypothetical protein